MRARATNAGVEGWAGGLCIAGVSLTNAFVGFRGDVGGDPIQFYRFTSGAGNATNGSGYSIDTWYNIAIVTRTTTDRSIWVNNTETTGSFTAATANFDTLVIGAFYSNNAASNYLDGQVDRFGVYDVAWTSVEMAQFVAGFSPQRIRPQSLRAYVPLLRNVQQIRSPKNTNIVSLNAPTVTTGPRGYGL
jgi:hypothetical protein